MKFSKKFLIILLALSQGSHLFSGEMVEFGDGNESGYDSEQEEQKSEQEAQDLLDDDQEEQEHRFEEMEQAARTAKVPEQQIQNNMDAIKSGVQSGQVEEVSKALEQHNQDVADANEISVDQQSKGQAEASQKAADLALEKVQTDQTNKSLDSIETLIDLGSVDSATLDRMLDQVADRNPNNSEIQERVRDLKTKVSNEAAQQDVSEDSAVKELKQEDMNIVNLGNNLVEALKASATNASAERVVMRTEAQLNSVIGDVTSNIKNVIENLSSSSPASQEQIDAGRQVFNESYAVKFDLLVMEKRLNYLSGDTWLEEYGNNPNYGPDYVYDNISRLLNPELARSTYENGVISKVSMSDSMTGRSFLLKGLDGAPAGEKGKVLLENIKIYESDSRINQSESTKQVLERLKSNPNDIKITSKELASVGGDYIDSFKDNKNPMLESDVQRIADSRAKSGVRTISKALGIEPDFFKSIRTKTAFVEGQAEIFDCSKREPSSLDKLSTKERQSLKENSKKVAENYEKEATKFRTSCTELDNQVKRASMEAKRIAGGTAELTNTQRVAQVQDAIYTMHDAQTAQVETGVLNDVSKESQQKADQLKQQADIQKQNEEIQKQNIEAQKQNAEMQKQIEMMRAEMEASKKVEAEKERQKNNPKERNGLTAEENAMVKDLVKEVKNSRWRSFSDSEGILDYIFSAIDYWTSDGVGMSSSGMTPNSELLAEYTNVFRNASPEVRRQMVEGEKGLYAEMSDQSKARVQAEADRMTEWRRAYKAGETSMVPPSGEW